jgi:hypothetical protein
VLVSLLLTLGIDEVDLSLDSKVRWEGLSGDCDSAGMLFNGLRASVIADADVEAELPPVTLALLVSCIGQPGGGAAALGALLLAETGVEDALPILCENSEIDVKPR